MSGNSLSSANEHKLVLKPKSLLTKIKLSVHEALNQIDGYSSGMNIHSGFLKILKRKFQPSFTRTKLLLKFLPQLDINKNNISAQELLIINFCTALELLHLAAETHSLIESPLRDQQAYNIDDDQIILFGDLFFTISFEKILLLNNDQFLQHLADTTLQMAEAEALLSNAVIEPNEKKSYNDLFYKIAKKYWPLFNSIIFFYHLHVDDQKSLLTLSQEVLEQHNIYLLKKISKQRLMVNQQLHHIVYNDSAIKYFKDINPTLSAMNSPTELKVQDRHLLLDH